MHEEIIDEQTLHSVELEPIEGTVQNISDKEDRACPIPRDPFPVTGKPIEPNFPGKWIDRGPGVIEITD